MPAIPGNDINLGYLPGREAMLSFPRTLRDKHLYVCGGTGTGKSKFLEHMIRQDILAWRKSKCGMLVLDPHGSLYDSLMKWMAWHKIDRPVVPIDLRQDDWVVSYNLLRQRKSADPGVLTDNITNAMAYVWGAEGTKETPLFARWIGNVILTLYEQKLTLVESEMLIDRIDKQMRYVLTNGLTDVPARQDWQLAGLLSPKDFEAQIGSTINRLRRFVRTKVMRSMFGLPGASLDLGKALEDGQIIIVSLATERAKVSKENADLFATLLLSDLWTAAQERGKYEGVKPFYVYLDEFQRFVTPTIADNLDEARGYGLHLTLAHQFPNQLLDRGDNGRRVYNSIMENASSKVVFRLTHDENLSVMARWLFTGVMSPDKIKHELYSTKVMAYREELKVVQGKSRGKGASHGFQSGLSSGAGLGGTRNFIGDEITPEADSISESQSDFAATSESESNSFSISESESTSTVPTLVPVLGKELSHVQFQSLEEQLFRAMAFLFDQQERHGVARLAGMSAPVTIKTPTVETMPGDLERRQAYIALCYSRFEFAVSGVEAQRLLDERAKTLKLDLINELSIEPDTAKRKVK